MHAVQLLNDKIAALMPFKNKTVRARACCRIRNCRDFLKKGKRKPTCHFASSVYSLPTLGVFTFRIVLNRILHKSNSLAPVESRRTRRPTFTAEERLERDRRRHAERRARERREQTQARRDVDRLRSSQARALETVEETAARRDVDRLQSSQARASETVEETAARRDVERLRSSQARAAETVEETTARTEVQRLRSSQARNRRRMAVTRAGETIIRDFSQNCADIHHRTWLRLGFFYEHSIVTTTRMCFSGCRSVCSSLDHRRISQSSHLSCVDIIVFYSFHDRLHRH